MQVDEWLNVVYKAYNSGYSIDLITAERTVMKELKLTEKQKQFITTKISNEIFDKVFDEYERIAYKSGAISLIQYHFTVGPLFNEGEITRIIETFGLLQGYFWDHVNNKKTFGSVSRIKEKNALGCSIEQYYSIDSGPFIDFAKTYWTFRIEMLDLLEKNVSLPITQILIQIEASVASWFFPRLKPVKPDVRVLIEAQTNFLRKYTNNINVEKFISENPIINSLLHYD